jgi:membrane protease YdiL (CAAX protease family)
MLYHKCMPPKGWSLTFFIIVLIYIWLWVSVIIIKSPVLAMLGYYLVCCFFGGYILKRMTPSQEAYLFRLNRLSRPGLTTFVLSVIATAAIWSFKFLIRDGIIEPANIISGLNALGLTRQHFWFTAGLLIVVNPFAEEYLWRWSILPVFMGKFKPLTAMVIGSLLFAGYHPITVKLCFAPSWMVMIFILVFFGGMFLSYLLLRTHSLKYPIILHMVINANIMLIAYTLTAPIPAF